MRNRGVPDAHSVAAAAQVLPHNVETEKGEVGPVIDAGDGSRRGAVNLADKEAFRIGNGEADIID